MHLPPLARLLPGALVLAVTGCQLPHLSPDAEAAARMAQLKVAESFRFKTTQDIQLNVQVASPTSPGARYRVNVYDDFPTVGGLLTSGLTDASQRLRLEFQVPAPLKFIYVEKVDPFGVSDVLKIATASVVSADFKTTTPTVALRVAAGSGLDCTSGFTRKLENFSGNLDVKEGEVVAVTGTFRGGITINKGGTVRICGTATVENLNLNHKSAAVYFLEGATVSAANLNLNNKEARLFNYSDNLTITSTASFGGRVENHGKVTINGELNLNSNAELINNGDLTVASSLNNNSVITNYQSLLVKGSFRVNGSSTTTNHCKLIVNGELTLNNPLTNHAYVRADQRTTINGSGLLTNHNGALLSTKDMECNGSIAGAGGTKSTVRVTGNSRFNGGASISGNLNYWDENGIETNNSKIAASFFNSNNYLPTSACNPEGFGKPAVQDADSDGVPDTQDDNSTDAEVAFSSYYPSSNGYGAHCFEDKWPGKGDYDFNDLVLGFRITKKMNGAGKVVKLTYALQIRAVGATYTNGFGFQLDNIASDEVRSVSGMRLTKNLISLKANQTEAGQAKAVVIAYDSPDPVVGQPSGALFNVVKGSPASPPGNLEVEITFRQPIDPDRLSQASINPFIFVNGHRGREVHLCNYRPTDKATSSLFGTIDDSGVRNYRTRNNLPWCLEVPADFKHPIEGAPVNQAYLHFEAWALTGGGSYNDWYVNKGGYVNPDKIF